MIVVNLIDVFTVMFKIIDVISFLNVMEVIIITIYIYTERQEISCTELYIFKNTLIHSILFCII